MYVIRIVTGRRDSGKSSYLRSLARSTGAGGFIAEKAYGVSGEIGFDLLTLPSGDRRPLARVAGDGGSAPGAGWFRFRRFFFDEASFRWARERAAEILKRSDCPLILDEIGPLELEGRGLYSVFLRFLASSRELTVSCRPALASWVGERAAGELGSSTSLSVISLLP